MLIRFAWLNLIGQSTSYHDMAHRSNSIYKSKSWTTKCENESYIMKLSNFFLNKFIIIDDTFLNMKIGLKNKVTKKPKIVWKNRNVFRSQFWVYKDLIDHVCSRNIVQDAISISDPSSYERWSHFACKTCSYFGSLVRFICERKFLKVENKYWTVEIELNQLIFELTGIFFVWFIAHEFQVMNHKLWIIGFESE